MSDHCFAYFVANFKGLIKHVAFNDQVIVFIRWPVTLVSFTALLMGVLSDSYLKSSEFQMSDLDTHWKMDESGKLLRVTFNIDAEFDRMRGLGWNMSRVFIQIIQKLSANQYVDFDSRLRSLKRIGLLQFEGVPSPEGQEFSNEVRPHITRSLSSRVFRHARKIGLATAAAAVLVSRGFPKVHKAVNSHIRNAEIEGRNTIKRLLYELNRIQSLKHVLDKLETAANGKSAEMSIIMKRKGDIVDSIEDLVGFHESGDFELTTPASSR